MRLVQARDFTLDAAVVDWVAALRERHEDPKPVLEDLRKRGIGATSLQLRWILRATAQEGDARPALGMPSGAFTVWMRQRKAARFADVRSVPRLAPGGQFHQLVGEPCVYVRASLTMPAGGSAMAYALSGPPRLENVLSVVAVPAGNQVVTLWGNHITAVWIVSSTAVQLTALAGVRALQYANEDAWVAVEQVGLPVEPAEWGDRGRHAEKQGFVTALVPPADAAIDRLRRGAAPMGWWPAIGATPAPTWKRPDFGDLVAEMQAELLPTLHPVMGHAPHRQHLVRVPRAVPPPSGRTGTMSPRGRSDVTYAPLAVMAMAASTDPLLALTLGFGTAYAGDERLRLVDQGFNPAVGLAAPTTAPDFMVTADWDKGLDGASAPLTLAAVAIQPRAAFPCASPANASAVRHSLNRPDQPDTPWDSAVRMQWDRTPRNRFTRPASCAFARLDPAQPTQTALPLMAERRSGGHAPLALASDVKDPQANRVFAVDSHLSLPMAVGSLNLRYAAATHDLWGQWSRWVGADHSDAQPVLERVRVLACALLPEVPAAGRVCPTTLQVDVSVDWKVRRPAHLEFVARLFAAPTGADTAPPATPVPAGVQLNLAGATRPAVVIPFSGDADALPAGSDITVQYLDLSGELLVTPGPVDSDPQTDVRRYRIRIPGLQLDFGAVPHVGVSVWCRMTERAAPNRTSSFTGAGVLDGAGLAYAADPVPPAMLPLPAPALGSMPDASNQSHVQLRWGAAAGAVAYHVYEASESALLAAALPRPPQGDEPAAGPDFQTTLPERLDRVLDILEARDMRRAFTRRAGLPIAGLELDVALPRGTREIHFFHVVGVNAGHVESAWPTPVALRSQVFRFVAPGVARPAPPMLELRSTTRSGVAAVQLIVNGRHGDAMARLDIHRTRVEEAARTLDTMGPALATLTTAAPGGWTITPQPDGRFRAVGEDRPEGSWKKLWYRVVAWGAADVVKGLLPGRSPPSNAMSVLVPPAAPPDLSPLGVVWPGGPLEALEFQFTSLAPVAPTPLGPHTLELQVRVSGGPTAALPAAALLDVSTPLQEVANAAPPSGLWRHSATAYSVRVQRPDINDAVAVTARLRDPLGRVTERTLAVAAGPVDPPPDVLDLEIIRIAGRGLVLSWRSHAPVVPLPAGAYRLRITLLPRVTRPLPPIPPRPPIKTIVPIRPPLRQPEAGAGEFTHDVDRLLEHGPARPLSAAPGVAVRPALIDPVVVTVTIDPRNGRPRPIVIDMPLPDVPSAGRPPALPAGGWWLERSASATPPVGYSLRYMGEVTQAVVRITAPDGRFAEARV